MTAAVPLVEHFAQGLDSPICLTWELTYACNLACHHCLSSSGRRDPRELTTAEAKSVIDELQRMQVFYVNIGGGEPTIRPDFWEILDYATAHDVGVKFSTNGVRITRARGRSPRRERLRRRAGVVGRRHGRGQRRRARRGVLRHRDPRAWSTWRPRGCRASRSRSSAHGRTSRSSTRFKEIADRYGAQLRLTRLRPSGRGADVWDELHPTDAQQRELYDWLLARGEDVLTGDSFFHLAGYGEALPGLNLCGAGRVVCLIDPVGDVYACPFAIHDALPGRQRPRRRRVPPRVARVRAVRDAARAAVRRRVHLVLVLRRVPWRVHGGEVLHGPARSTDPIPSASRATAQSPWPASHPVPRRARRDHSRPARSVGECP